MGAFKKADYYYGALLSLLMNNGMKPALFEKENYDDRKRYTVTTNNGEYEFYCKYMSNPTGKDDLTWSFNFTDKECKEISSLLKLEKKIIFALICTQKDLTSTKQEVALVYKDEFVKCVELKTYKDSAPRLSVKMTKFSNYLKIYGNKRADKIGKVDNTIKIERSRMQCL